MSVQITVQSYLNVTDEELRLVLSKAALLMSAESKKTLDVANHLTMAGFDSTFTDALYNEQRRAFQILAGLEIKSIVP